MHDRWAIALALATCAGAVVGHELPLPAGLAAGALALALRRPALLAVAGFVLASGLAARAEAGLAPPPSQPVRGEVVLLDDPAPFRSAVRAEVRVGRRRVEAEARGAAAAALEDRLAGEVLTVEGRLGALPERARSFLHPRHVSARLQLHEVRAWRPGAWPTRLANGLRRTLDRGASPLGPTGRSLFLGMVIGDDREQPVEVADDFDAAGLTHLLAVSGQNVAFVLALARPLLWRLRFTPRWATTMALLAGFALLTRFEPSVLRATAMAAVAATAFAAGRPASRLRVLALAVTGLVLLDPFLVRALGFQLSVGATVGIALLAGPLTRRLPGPAVLREGLGVCLAAQVGVAPVLLPAFGGLPLASLPANVLAVPAAGPVLGWGLPAGLLAGVVGPPLDGVLHLPTGLLVGWVAAVARTAARLPLGTVTVAPFVALVAGAVAGALAARRSRAAGAALVTSTAALVLLAGVRPAAGALDGDELVSGARVWRRDAVVLALDRPDPARLLARLRAAGIERVDVLLVTGGGRDTAGTVALLRRRVAVRTVLAAEDHAVRGAVVPAEGVVRVGGLAVEVRTASPELDVVVTGVAPAARSP